jgi:long-chain fatty acid transport protein
MWICNKKVLEDKMRKKLKVSTVVAMIMLLSPVAWATNGDNLIGIGPISRAMGGVGIAAPQDAISAVFANPAAMCFGPYCPSSEFNFAGTLFMPDVSAEVNGAGGGGALSANSNDATYPIPAIGISTPITKDSPFWRFGLSAYGVTGLGVDYRGSSLDQPGFFPIPPPNGPAPLVTGEFSQLNIMKFAPAIAFQPNNQWSFGAAVHINWATLDLRNGTSPDYSYGVQLGTIFKPTDAASLGLTYISAQKAKHEDVINFGGNLFDLELEAPQQVGAGAAYEWSDFLVEADAKWINWADTDGYGDFDWDDQWVFAIGAQYRATEKLTLRIGYNYGENPVEENDGFPGGPSTTTVQGIPFPTYYYETFRIIGFPAIVEQHITFGIGYEFTPTFAVNLGYVYGLSETIEETGMDPFGNPVTIESELSEQSFEFGLTWRF